KPGPSRAGFPDPATAPDWAGWFLRLAAVRVNPKKFDAFDALEGVVFASDDGGATFEKAANDLRAVPDYELHFTTLRAVPGHEGHLWITTKDRLARSTDPGQSFDPIARAEEAYGD